MTTPNSVLLVTNMPTPYRIPLFNELNRQLSEKGLKLVVVFGTLSEKRRKWNIDLDECKFEYKILKQTGIKFRKSETVSLMYFGLISLVNSIKPVCIVTPGFSMATIQLYILSLIRPLKFVVWSGEINSQYRKNSSLKEYCKKIIVRRVSRFIAYGSLAKNYLISLGAHGDKIDIAINTVDTRYFIHEAQKYRKDGIWDTDLSFIYVGDFVPRKRIDLILSAVKKLRQTRQDFKVKLIGDGPEKESVEALCTEMNVDDIVEFVGYVQKLDMPEQLANSICMLFPTGHDIWGLVVVEAMAAGVMCISSNKAGATHDLIEHDVNGFNENFENVDRIVEKMNWVLDNPEKAVLMGEKAKLYIEDKASISVSSAGMVSAISAIV